MSDWSALLTAVGEHRDREAYIALFRHFSPLLKAYIKRLGVMDAVVEEVLQDTLLSVWRKAGSYDASRAPAGAWIYTLARNQSIDWMRKQKYPTYSLEDTHLDDQAEQHQGDQQYLAERMAHALQSLPEAQAQVVYMSFYEGRSHAEIANRLGIPLGSVKSRMRLASEKLRAHWGDEA